MNQAEIDFERWHQEGHLRGGLAKMIQGFGWCMIEWPEADPVEKARPLAASLKPRFLEIARRRRLLHFKIVDTLPPGAFKVE